MEAQGAVLRVGDARGFVVEHRNHRGWNERIVITAAHVIAHATLGNETEGLLSCHPARPLNEEIYPRLLGPLGGDRTVWAQCCSSIRSPISPCSVSRTIKS
jgi:hypothetical protein